MSGPDPIGTIFSTRYNLQKIYLNNSMVLNLASSITPTEYTLATHNLGYIPTARVFYIPVSGQLWPISPQQYSNLDGGPGTTLNFYGSPIITTTELKIRIVNASGSSANVVFYYRIYIDE